MRIWSIHPKYLDAKGLVALWRETLLAKKVLEGQTRGYRNHPQLERFKQSENPLDNINHYLSTVYSEALERDYHFDKEKIDWSFKASRINVTSGQIKYETEHLLKKLSLRDRDKFEKFSQLDRFEANPIFRIVEGDIESWEKP